MFLSPSRILTKIIISNLKYNKIARSSSHYKYFFKNQILSIMSQMTIPGTRHKNYQFSQESGGTNSWDAYMSQQLNASDPVRKTKQPFMELNTESQTITDCSILSTIIKTSKVLLLQEANSISEEETFINESAASPSCPYSTSVQPLKASFRCLKGNLVTSKQENVTKTIQPVVELKWPVQIITQEKVIQLVSFILEYPESANCINL